MLIGLSHMTSNLRWIWINSFQFFSCILLTFNEYLTENENGRTFDWHYIGIFLCHIRTCTGGCSINKQKKVELIFSPSITRISTSPITEYFSLNIWINMTQFFSTKCWFLTKRKKLVKKRREKTQLKLVILTLQNVSTFFT